MPNAAVVPLAKAAPIIKTMAAYNRLGLAQTLTGQFAQARQSFDAASALAPDDLDIRTNLALAAALEGQETKAIDVARSVVSSPGAPPRHRRNLMIVYGLLGLVDEGRAAAPKGFRQTKRRNCSRARWRSAPSVTPRRAPRRLARSSVELRAGGATGARVQRIPAPGRAGAMIPGSGNPFSQQIVLQHQL